MLSSSESRSEYREAPRKPGKVSGKQPQAEAKQEAAAPVYQDDWRAAINRANAAQSTGPRTQAGKAKSSQNAFKHGLYSQQLVIQGEDAANLDALRADLRAEHQPNDTTEEILVNEVAEQFWRLKRMRRLEADVMNAENIDDYLKLLALVQRNMAAAERGFHKSLAALQKSQKTRGFVPQIATHQPVREPQIGFVSSNPAPQPPIPGFIPSIYTQTVASKDPLPATGEQLAA